MFSIVKESGGKFRESEFFRFALFLLVNILLMGEMLHQLIGSLSHYLKRFMHARWLFGISSTNSIDQIPSRMRPEKLVKMRLPYRLSQLHMSTGSFSGYRLAFPI